MSDVAVEGEEKPAKPPSLISLSFGGFNSISIVLSSISILRLATAHERITLHGIVADVIEWYKNFFHESFDVAVDWVNTLHVHWLHLPHISDSAKDTAVIILLFYFILYRTLRMYLNFFESRYGITNPIMKNIIYRLIMPLPIFLLATYQLLSSTVRGKLEWSQMGYPLLYTSFFFQFCAVIISVTSMLVLSAYS